jgi:putative membrane protein
MLWRIIRSLFRLIALPVTVIAAVLLVPGLAIESRFLAFGFAIAVTMMNFFIKPILNLSSIGCSIVALGPVYLIANTMALWFARLLPFGITVENFWAAFWGGLLISIISFIMNMQSGN